MTKWIVLSFVIPEVLVLGVLTYLAIFFSGFEVDVAGLVSFFFYGFLYALIPGALASGVIWFLYRLEDRYQKTLLANQDKPDA